MHLVRQLKNPYVCVSDRDARLFQCFLKNYECYLTNVELTNVKSLISANKQQVKVHMSCYELVEETIAKYDSEKNDPLKLLQRLYNFLSLCEFTIETQAKDALRLTMKDVITLLNKIEIIYDKNIADGKPHYNISKITIEDGKPILNTKKITIESIMQLINDGLNYKQIAECLPDLNIYLITTAVQHFHLYGSGKK